MRESLPTSGNRPKCRYASCGSSVRHGVGGWWTILDEGISGAKDRRPALDRLMADAHKRKFDAVVVWKFDRFARSVSHLLRALENFQALGIAFVSLSESLDTSTPAGKMVFTVLGAVAELERSLIGERVRAGLRNAKAKGVILGRPPLKRLTTADVRQLRHDRNRVSVLATRPTTWHQCVDGLPDVQAFEI